MHSRYRHRHSSELTIYIEKKLLSSTYEPQRFYEWQNNDYGRRMHNENLLFIISLI